MSELSKMEKLILEKMPPSLTTRELRFLLVTRIRPNKEVAKEIMGSLMEKGAIIVSGGIIKKKTQI